MKNQRINHISRIGKIVGPFILLAVFLTIARLNTFNTPYDRDEGGYAYIAYFYSQGVLPYRDVFDQKPPLIYLIYYFSEIINPGGVWGPRVLVLIFTYISSVLLYFIAKKEFGRRSGLIAMWIYVSMLLPPLFNSYAANTEIFMTTFVLAAYSIFVYCKSSIKTLPVFFYGLFGFLAVFTKPICAPIIGYLIVNWLFSTYKQSRRFSEVVRTTLAFLAGFGLPLFTFLLFFWFKGVLHDFIKVVILYNYSYTQNLDGGKDNLFTLLFVASIYWLSSYLLSLHFYIYSKKRLFFLGLTISSMLLVFNSPFGHYYLQIVPFLALTASVGCDRILNNFKGPFIRLMFVITVLLTTIVPNIEFLTGTQSLQTRMTYGTINPFLSSPETAKKVGQITGPEDTVLVYGYEPQILYYAKRKSASRFIYNYPQVVPSKFRQQYEDEFVNDILRNKPLIIIYSPLIRLDNRINHPSQSLINRVDEIINNSYEAVDGSYFDKIGLDPLHYKSLPLDTLILYKRKI